MSIGTKRTLGVPVVAALVAGSLAACSGSSLPEMKSSPAVTASGKHYTYSASHVRRSQWPDPCSLLTRSSAQAAVGTTVTVKRFHTNCIYQPGSEDFPTLTITLLSVGTGADASYRKVSVENKGEDRLSISGVGRDAYLHRVRHLPAIRLNVLTRYAHLSITEQSAVGQKLTLPRARTLLVSVGRAVAKAFAG